MSNLFNYIYNPNTNKNTYINMIVRKISPVLKRFREVPIEPVCCLCNLMYGNYCMVTSHYSIMFRMWDNHRNGNSINLVNHVTRIIKYKNNKIIITIVLENKTRYPKNNIHIRYYKKGRPFLLLSGDTYNIDNYIIYPQYITGQVKPS